MYGDEQYTEVLAGESERKRPLGRPKQRLEEKIVKLSL
jgi:hypothetical protein